MKKVNNRFIHLDEETGHYVMDQEQVVRDQVEKDHWLIVLRNLLKDWRLYLMLVPMLFIFFCWRYLPMYELLASFKVNTTGALKVSDQFYCGFNNYITLLFGDYKF